MSYSRHPFQPARRLWLRGAAAACIAALGAAGALPARAQGGRISLRGEGRIALVIGNGGYTLAPLQNPVNDARAVGSALRDLGFEVLQRENASLEAMLETMREFVQRARDAQVRVVYYAGHGTQLKGKNYMIPVEAELNSEEDIPTHTANATDFIDRLGNFKSGVNIVILDACRNTRFPVGPRTRGLGAARSLAPGLAQAQAPNGTLIAFSTAPGAVAFDGTEGNSIYAKHLVSNMRVPGLPVEQLFKRVRIAVSEETRKKQIPWESSSLMGDFCFKSSADGDCIGANTDVVTVSRERR